MTNVMTNAWEIAYEGVAKFGGEVKEYFAEALRIAWNLFKKGGNEVKEEMHTGYLVSHDNGNSEIVIAVRHINKEIEKSSFHNIEDKVVDCNKIEIRGVKLNGEGVFRQRNSMADIINHHQHGLVLRLYNVTIDGKRHDRAFVLIDQATKDAVYAPYNEKREALKALKAKEVKLEKTSYEKELCNICHSICYGDCN